MSQCKGVGSYTRYSAYADKVKPTAFGVMVNNVKLLDHFFNKKTHFIAYKLVQHKDPPRLTNEAEVRRFYY